MKVYGTGLILEEILRKEPGKFRWNAKISWYFFCKSIFYDYLARENLVHFSGKVSNLILNNGIKKFSNTYFFVWFHCRSEMRPERPSTERLHVNSNNTNRKLKLLENIFSTINLGILLRVSGMMVRIKKIQLMLAFLLVYQIYFFYIFENKNATFAVYFRLYS